MLTGGFATQAAVLKNLQYEPLKDFAFITSVVRYPMVYTVRPDSPIKSFKDMIERAKANPGKVSYGIVGAGNVYHLLGKWIDNAAGVEMNAVPYRGTALALQDVLGGRVDVLSDAATSTIPRVLSGQLRALAVSSAEPYPLLPGVPTMAETLPGIKVESWLGLAATGRHAAADRRPAEQRIPPRAGTARSEKMGRGIRRGAGALDPGGVSRARRERRPSVDRDRRPQQHQHSVAAELSADPDAAPARPVRREHADRTIAAVVIGAVKAEADSRHRRADNIRGGSHSRRNRAIAAAAEATAAMKPPPP